MIHCHECDALVDRSASECPYCAGHAHRLSCLDKPE
jgi:RNA polymerase subunit RPABC4/transcription elongation factor Spt4